MDKIGIRQRIRDLRIKTKRIMGGVRFGMYSTRSAAHDGLEFDALREYQEGDDIRRMDWHSSARSNRLMVRTYRENKQSKVLLVLDESASMKLGSTRIVKAELMRELAVILGCCVEQEGGMLGLLRMGHDATYVIPCKSGKSHIQNVYETIFDEAVLEKRSAARAVEALGCASVLSKDTCIFFFTDGTDELCEQFVRLYAQRAILVVVRIRDPYEVTGVLPCGVVAIDPETQQVCELLTLNQRQQVAQAIQQWYTNQDVMMRARKVTCIDIQVDKPYERIVRNALQRGV